MSDIKLELASTVLNLVITKGLPALVEFVSELNTVAKDSDFPTVAEIKAVKSKLDSADYFPGLK